MTPGRLFAASLVLLASTPTQASSCEAIREQVEAKIRASGVTRFSVTIVDAAARPSGKVVGTCDLGTKKLVYQQSPSPAPTRSEAILTECRDGTVTRGGDCRK